MRVLYLFGGEKASGAEIVVERLMSYNFTDIEAHLFISPGTFANKLLSSDKAIKVTCVDYLKKLSRDSNSIWKFYLKAVRNYFAVSILVHRYMLKHKISVVHANTIVPASYLLPLVLFSRIFFRKRKWVWSDHDLSYWSIIDGTLSKICSKLYNKTLAVSKAVKAKYPNNKNVKVLYNGIDFEKVIISEDLRREFRSNNNIQGKIVFGILGQLINRKGVRELIDSFNQVFKDADDVVLIVAGPINDAETSYGKKTIEEAGKSNLIKYVGIVEDINLFYNAIDVLVNNSKLEGAEPLGTTIIEALCYDKIVMVSNVGGSPEILQNSLGDIIYSPNDQLALNEALKLSSLKVKDNSDAITIRSKDERFNIETMVTEYNKIIFSL